MIIKSCNINIILSQRLQHTPLGYLHLLIKQFIKINIVSEINL
ncbi:unnamed protein product [Paramecium octaurelia]|uniref:Uncharacterized protein n=1 Tax=Paramecium octaurelia TaxID=43137 RepID=A0A8S1V6A5_PAROT|nr:unnamed protein product [Paramecium octaurelia]